MQISPGPAGEIVAAVARFLDKALASPGIENARRAVLEADKRRQARTALEQLDRRDPFEEIHSAEPLEAKLVR